MLDIVPIPALQDNYIWMIVNEVSHAAAVVDPGEAKPVIQALQSRHLNLCAILITHHHWDHTNGIDELYQQYPVPIYGPAQENIPHCDFRLQEDDQFHLPELNTTWRVLDIPGHTLGHIAYFGHNSLFCGDTLFTGGCGRIFEGTPDMMLRSLQKLAALPQETAVYCGHEYTQNNLKFAKLVDPDNAKLKKRIDTVLHKRSKQLPTVPAPLHTELETNPFLRCHLPEIQQHVSSHTHTSGLTTISTFAALRQWKDHF